MSKKLLIAVLTLGLLFAYCGAVLGSDDNPTESDAIPFSARIHPNPLLTGTPIHQASSLSRPPDDNALSANITLFPPQYYCEFIDYSGGNFAKFSTIPNGAGFDYYNMRHTAAEGYACTLLTTWIAVYPPKFYGTPDLVVKVWGDDGFGLPGTELASVTLPYGDLPPTGTSGAFYVGADFSSFNLVFVNGENYYVGVSTTDQSGADTLAFLLDDGTAGTGRSGFYDTATMQFYNRAIEGYADYNYGFGVDVCCADLPYSSCGTQEYDCGPYWIFTQPSEYGTDYYSTKFSVGGADTLIAVNVGLYHSGTIGTPGLDLYVTGGSGGFPDLTNIMYQTTVDNLNLTWYPGVTSVALPGSGLVMPPGSDFYVVAQAHQNVPGDSLCFLLDFGDCGAGRSFMQYGGDWYTNFDIWGADENWIMSVDICKDEFSECNRIYPYCVDVYDAGYSMPSSGGTGRIGGFTMVEPVGVGCRLGNVHITIDNPYWFGLDPGFNYDAEMVIREDDGGMPGAILASTTVANTDLVEWPDYLSWEVSSLNILFDAPLWIGIVTDDPEPYGTTPDIMIVADDGSCGGTSLTYYEDGSWGVATRTFWVDAFACCIPPPERDCLLGQPDPNWPTAGHDFRRSSASFNSVGDAKCNQALAWKYSDPTGLYFNRPVIYDGIVLGAWSGTSTGVLRALDIADGSLIWSKTGLGEAIGGSFRITPTVKDGYVYYGGGSARGISKADVYTGAVQWSRGAIQGTPLSGYTVFTTTVLLDCGGTEVLYLATDNGSVYALDASTGALYPGWTVNPVVLDGNPTATLSSNGVDVVYVATDGLAATGNGTIYAFDACTGAINWSLGEADLAGATISGNADPQEEFYGPLGVDEDGAIYAQTGCWGDANSSTPSGVAYRFSPSGTIVWAKGSRLAYFEGPVLDANNVYFTTIRYWTSELNQTSALKKSNGAKIWDSDPFFNGSSYVEGALSCEPLVSDKLFVGNRNSQFLVMDTDDGSVEFEYNYIAGSTYGCGIAIDPTHVIMTNRSGDMFCMTNQTDRPRLRLLKFDELQAVPFFSPNGFLVTFTDVFMNNGCVNLTGNLTVDESAPAAYAWSVDPDRVYRLTVAASSLVDNTYESVAKHLVKPMKVPSSELDLDFTTSAYAKDSYSKDAAYGPPAWLNNVTVPNFDLAPGQTFDVTYDVNGPLVTRGPHRAYVSINSNDQYFLNSTDAPAVQLGVLGGCLQSDDFIAFGVGEANRAPVFNTGEIGNRDGACLWAFDGDSTEYWQGGLFFAAEGDDGHRLAWTTDSWHGADPPDFWNSLLPDPNCFGLCEPYVTPSPIVLGAISHDGGLTYTDVEGYATAVAYIDSVVNFDCYGTGWSWANTECPYDNALTIGLRVEQFMYAAIDEPALANVVIFRHNVTNRNATPIVNVGMGAFNDFDMSQTDNGTDCFLFDANYSIAWGASSSAAYDFHNGAVWGDGKIPMDVDPMLGSATIDANQAMWETNNVFLDSIYYYLANVRGQTSQAGITIAFPSTTVSDDRDQWAGYIFRDFAANETFSFGTYMFGFEPADVTDAAFFQNLAKTVNQFAGFNRGDINNDGVVNLADVVALWNMVNASGPGPLFQHLADVDATGGAPNNADVLYLANYYFCSGPAPVGDWVLPNICPAP